MNLKDHQALRIIAGLEIPHEHPHHRYREVFDIDLQPWGDEMTSVQEYDAYVDRMVKGAACEYLAMRLEWLDVGVIHAGRGEQRY